MGRRVFADLSLRVESSNVDTDASSSGSSMGKGKNGD
jgi:hypothetical protein